MDKTKSVFTKIMLMATLVAASVSLAVPTVANAVDPSPVAGISDSDEGVFGIKGWFDSEKNNPARFLCELRSVPDNY